MIMVDKTEQKKTTYGELHDLNLKLVIALRRSMQPEERKLNALLAEHGLTLAQFGVLESLYHVGPMNIKEIIEKSLSSSGNMTVVIKNLVKSEYITKDKDPEDGRAFIIKLTSKGQDVITQIFPRHLIMLEKVFSTLEKDEKRTLLELLKKLNKYPTQESN